MGLHADLTPAEERARYKKWQQDEEQRKEDALATVRHRQAIAEFAEVISMDDFSVLGYHDFSIPNRCGVCRLIGIRSAENHYFMLHNARYGMTFHGLQEKNRRERDEH